MLINNNNTNNKLKINTTMTTITNNLNKIILAIILIITLTSCEDNSYEPQLPTTYTIETVNYVYGKVLTNELTKGITPPQDTLETITDYSRQYEAIKINITISDEYGNLSNIFIYHNVQELVNVDYYPAWGYYYLINKSITI